jgi:hypothetical protein
LEAIPHMMDPPLPILEAEVDYTNLKGAIKNSKVSTDGSFDGNALMQKILERYSKTGAGPGQDDYTIDWDSFDKEAATYFAATPSASFLLHSLSKDAKPKKQGVVVQQEKQQVRLPAELTLPHCLR